MISKIRTSVIDGIGVRATHALQDGFTLGAVLCLSVVYPPALTVIAGALGIDAVRPKKILKNADKFVREEQIAENPEYFLIGFLPWVFLTIGAGVFGYVGLSFGLPFGF